MMGPAGAVAVGDSVPVLVDLGEGRGRRVAEGLPRGFSGIAD